ncbi:N-acetylmuramoyl-L-alanine amidase [Brevibacillus dissolubilis]|uniref:N-acetylmuramoyl-L-alanine amidase n=1 Tax=Brevibacillus dissolubilis TaxID=1844116 RepID=UPI00210029A5|nr:peptidoglycan recognition family protein [Brevibacillus dissolubilis]
MKNSGHGIKQVIIPLSVALMTVSGVTPWGVTPAATEPASQAPWGTPWGVAPWGTPWGTAPWGVAPWGVSTAHAEEVQADSLQKAFHDAAAEFKVPVHVLMSVSYNMTRWEHHNGEPSAQAGYGLMHLTQYEATTNPDENAAADSTSTSSETDPTLHTLDTAASILQLDAETLKKDPAQNIRGGAALLAKYAQETTGQVPTEEKDWYGAVAKYIGSEEKVVAYDFADQVYQSINEGLSHTTTGGQSVVLAAKTVTPNRDTAQSLKLKESKSDSLADCPEGLKCDFIPAFYQQRSSSPSNYGNYDTADRPNFGPDIRYIVIHNTEVSYQGTINWFQNPIASVSAHYVLRSSDGHIAQMVDNKDVAWHAGNWYYNMHSIGLEHEGYMLEGAKWFNEHQYRASAKLVKYLADKYDIPLDRAHIFGHDEIPALTAARQRTMHEDPGAFWDWEHYMELLGAPITPAHGTKEIVTFKPHFETNRPYIEGVESQPANFVYLYQEPSFDAPLFDDVLYPGPGSYSLYEEGSKAPTGQSFYLADEQGDWQAIWFGGQKAWFHNPQGKVTVPGKGTLITPKAGKESIEVYGGAYPEASAFPAGISPRTLTPLYTIPQGQKYVAVEKIKSNFYNATVFSHNPTATHKMVFGNEEYYRIHFGHRYGFVKASDVDVVNP